MSLASRSMNSILAVLLLLRLGAKSSMHQFGDGYDRYANLDFALHLMYMFQELPNSAPSTFGGNNNA
jgi:hypothetical protein